VTHHHHHQQQQQQQQQTSKKLGQPQNANNLNGHPWFLVVRISSVLSSSRPISRSSSHLIPCYVTYHHHNHHHQQQTANKMGQLLMANHLNSHPLFLMVSI
jgi:hypothetical protein